MCRRTVINSGIMYLKSSLNLFFGLYIDNNAQFSYYLMIYSYPSFRLQSVIVVVMTNLSSDVIDWVK